MLTKTGLGVDIGSRFVKVAKVRRKGSFLVIERLLKVPRGPQEETLSNLASGMREAGIPATGAVIGVSGRGSILRYTHIPAVPDFRLKLIMEYEMAELVGKSAESVSSDYRLLNVPSEAGQDYTVLIAMSRDDYLGESIGFVRGAGIAIKSALPTSLALYNTFLALCQYEENQTYLLVDMGASNTDIAIVAGKDLYFARSIGKGADDFTEAVSGALGVGLDEAEKIKLSEGVIESPVRATGRQKTVSDCLAQAADRFYSVLNSTLGFAKTQLKLKSLKIDRVFLFGGGASLTGLAEHLTKSFGVPVTVPNLLAHRGESEELLAIDRRLRLGDSLPPEDIACATASLSEFACAIGLAVSGLDSALVALDIMPRALKRKREFKEKTVFLYAAAAACAVFLVMRYAGAISDSYLAASREETLQQVDRECQQRLEQFKKITGENEMAENALSSAAKVADAGSFITNLLFLLRNTEIVPHQIRIEEISLKREGAAQRASAILKGEVVAERGNEFVLLREFRERLKNHKLIEDAAIDPSKTQELQGRFLFEMTVVARNPR
jgi:type IV pilus assembly protein PilM